ncbi:hypothetical protein K2X30_15910 [bacterium]|nr:hypothetical protein [bacterium]
MGNLLNPKKRFALAILGAAALWGALPSICEAKDLQGRFGLGYNNEFSSSSAENGVPAISFKYHFTKDIGMEGVIGASTASPSNSVFGVKFFKNLFYETNLNFYFMLGGGLLNASNRSGAEFLVGFGAEFFIPGLESLGFSVETGGSFGNLSGRFVLQTLGASFLNAGMHFYF